MSIKKSIVSSANKKFNAGEFKEALNLYTLASELIGADFFNANIVLCNKRIASSRNTKKYKDNVIKDEGLLRKNFWAACKQSDSQAATKYLNDIKALGDNRKSNNEWVLNAERNLEKIKIPFDYVIEELKKRGSRIYEAEPNKIAYFLHNSLPYSSGGYATRAHGMATGLKLNGLNVICVTRPGFPVDTLGDHLGKEISDMELIDGIEYHRILKPSRSEYAANNYMLNAASEIEHFLIDKKVDMVMAASNHYTAIPAGIAARRLGLPYFYEVRGFWEITRISREPEYEKTQHYSAQVNAEVAAAQYADSVFTLTTPMKEELVRRGIPDEKITILANSCDPSRFTPRSRDINLANRLGIPDNIPVIGYIGSFVQYEGLENLAQASALLLNRGIDFRLLLVGNENASGSERGPITEEILRVAKEEGLASKLIMPGRIPHDQVEAYYSLIDIAPFPRKPQPVTEMVSPMKPLEALAMGKAVIVSSVRAMAEMVSDNNTGLVYKKGCLEDLTNKLEILITNPDLREKLGKNGRNWVQNERIWIKTALIAINKFNESILKYKAHSVNG